jgi:hypothetical protein
MNRCTQSWLVAVAVLATQAAVLRAEIPRAGASQDTLQNVLDRIHTHAGNELWKKGDFQDEAIEKWLDKLTDNVAKAAEFPELTLPVRLKDVRPKEVPPAGAAPARSQIESGLFVGRDIDLKDASLKRSIILADGSVNVSRIDACVIVARGVITVQMSSANSVIVGGVYIKLGRYDGVPNSTANGSLIVSRGWADTDNTYGTLIAAPEGISSGRLHSAIFLNARVPAGGLAAVGIAGANNARQSGSRSVKVADLPLEPLPVHPLAARLELGGIVHASRPAQLLPGRDQQVFGPTGLVFGFEERTHVAEVGQPIVDEAGEAVTHLRGWRLANVNSRFAVLVGPEDNAVIRFEKHDNGKKK